MKLPNGDRAIVDIEKLTHYCLNLHHPRGRNKARVFASIGIRLENAEELKIELLRAARDLDAEAGILNAFGQRYVVDFDLTNESRTAKIRSTWIVLAEENTPRLTGCYVL